MKTFTRDYRITGNYPAQFISYFPGMKPCILDIEATGLDPAKCKVCLAAFLIQTGSGVRVTQFLAENHYEENKVLDAMMDFLSAEQIDYLITFNGRAYDVPFINRRLELNYSEHRLSLFNFDLYRFLRKGTDLRDRVQSMSQMSLEDHYGIFSDRKDTITGRESVSLFNQYSLTGNSSVEKIILTHNREDVLQLHRLMYLAMDEPEDFDSAMALHGFPSSDGKLAIRPYISRQSKMLKICGEQLSHSVSGAFFPTETNPLNIQFNGMSSSFEISMPVSCRGSDFFADTQDLDIDISDDPDYINGYLILNSRTINRISLLITDRIRKELL